MALDQTYLLNKAKAFLGQSVTGQIDVTNEDLIKLLTEETLPTFSVYMPWLDELTIDTARHLLYPGREGIYQMQTTDELLGISRVLDGVGSFGSFPYVLPQAFGDPIDQQQVADKLSAVELQLTSKFTAPNVCEIFPKGYTYPFIMLEVKKVHPAHLQTVPPGARETLTQLFLADMANDVLGLRQYFASLQTAFGEINLNLDRLTEQANKRDDLVEKLRLGQLKTSGMKRIWIA